MELKQISNDTMKPQKLEKEKEYITSIKCHNLGDGQHMTPLFLQDVKVDTSIVIYVWVENFSPKCKLCSI